MKSRHLVDSELLGTLDTLPTIDLTVELLPAIRATGLPLQFEAPAPDAADVTRRKVPGPEGAPELEVAIYKPRPCDASLPCIFHMHGGGYVTGGTAALEAQSRTLDGQAILKHAASPRSGPPNRRLVRRLVGFPNRIGAPQSPSQSLCSAIGGFPLPTFCSSPDGIQKGFDALLV